MEIKREKGENEKKKKSGKRGRRLHAREKKGNSSKMGRVE